MEQSIIDKNWPNALRWFLIQNLHSFTPWHMLNSTDEFDFAAKAFEREDTSRGNVFVFASRQDNDDFAGLEIINGKITDKVICFHPVFVTGESDRSWNIVSAVYDNVFDFMSKQVIPDMKDWALTDDTFEL